MTGYWVAIVNEDWRWRMLTPAKGDFSSLNMLNPRGREVANQWDESQDGSCLAYGAAGLMRMPTRLHITWNSPDILSVETAAGRQTRLLQFAAAPTDSGPPSLQGDSRARWVYPATRPAGAGPKPDTGSLMVVTRNLQSAWLRRNGVPYSEQTTLTEYYDRFPAPDGEEWLVVTAVVVDPVYLSGRYVTSSHFRREADDSRWNPQDCRQMGE
jgi:hypothetical protein